MKTTIKPDFSISGHAEIPPPVEYSLTEIDKSLIPVSSTMIDWSLVHFDEVTK
jgi:DNA-binding HxlR family transcriptional regulator